MHRLHFRIALLTGLLGICALPLWAADNAGTNYPVLGIVIGTPSLGVNAIVGYDLGPVELRLSGGIGNSTNTANHSLSWGLQANVAYTFLDVKGVVSQFGLFGNYINLGNTTPSQVAGIGTAVSICLFGFFADVGLGVNVLPNHLQGLAVIAGILNFDFQIGYMYRFR